MSELPSRIDSLLAELADWLDFEDAGSLELLVCGGTAMGLQGLIQRETLDVDALGEWDSGQVEVVYKAEFSGKVNTCIRRVAERHPELGKNWVNLGPRELVQIGLPEGYEKRLISKKYGKALTLHLLAREDLIVLKLYSASDRWRKRQDVDIGDLKMMKATSEELDRALSWMRKLGKYEEMKPEIQYVLESLDYDGNPDYI